MANTEQEDRQCLPANGWAEDIKTRAVEIETMQGLLS
jgi:hypothetical protein